ncbi:hypothetical protein F511_06540 [Dorcoceras hygrometricum]|uniref:Uncharacterized protein n=1 Tax=Dorcoceras hygrometricum TaxID=472368 RepID=A0A2Z7CDB5_9LAMI|nr:hypothetical protein F511_06540 [Dorcoceras hygrometricum]
MVFGSDQCILPELYLIFNFQIEKAKILARPLAAATCGGSPPSRAHECARLARWPREEGERWCFLLVRRRAVDAGLTRREGRFVAREWRPRMARRLLDRRCASRRCCARWPCACRTRGGRTLRYWSRLAGRPLPLLGCAAWSQAGRTIARMMAHVSDDGRPAARGIGARCRWRAALVAAVCALCGARDFVDGGCRPTVVAASLRRCRDCWVTKESRIRSWTGLALSTAVYREVPLSLRNRSEPGTSASKLLTALLSADGLRSAVGLWRSATADFVGGFLIHQLCTVHVAVGNNNVYIYMRHCSPWILSGDSRRFRPPFFTFEVALYSSREALYFRTIFGGCSWLERDHEVAYFGRVFVRAGFPGYPAGRGADPARGAPVGG